MIGSRRVGRSELGRVRAPFVQTSVFTGAIAARLGVDVAWIVGLVVPAVLYVMGTVSKRELGAV
jgi:hypothetical protein